MSEANPSEHSEASPRSLKQPKIRPNWPAIRQEYQTGSISQRNLAKKHGIAYGTLDKRARKEGWFQTLKLASKKAIDLEATVQKKAAALVEDQLRPFIEKKRIEITRLGYNTAAKGLKRVNSLYRRPVKDGKAEADSARAVESLVRTARTSLGMNDGSSVSQPLNINILTNQSAVQINGSETSQD